MISDNVFIGKKFGKLTVISKANKTKKSTKYWLCKCDCGNEKSFAESNLLSNHNKSCGCLGKKEIRELSGKRFGKLTVISQIKLDTSCKPYWLCKCDCGREKNILEYSLLRGDTKTCGCSKRNYIDFIGKTFGRLTIISLSKQDKYKNNRYFCSCTCGKEITVSAYGLISGNTKSCGCLRKDIISLPNGQAKRNQVICGYKIDAKRRNISFELTNEETVILLSSNCYYCGCLPSTTRSSKYSTGSFTYNGIDRINNNVGYTTNNVIPCCKICNYAKNTQTQSQFISWVKNTFNHLKLNNLL